MDTVGTVYMGLGLYKEGRPLLARAVDQRRTLPDTTPGVMSESLSHLGELAYWQADYPIAEKSYREAIADVSAQPPTHENQAASDAVSGDPGVPDRYRCHGPLCSRKCDG